MTDYIVGAYDKIESILPMEGPLAIPARAGIGAGVGWILGSAAAPSWSYNKDGSKRPFAVFPGLYQGQGAPTYLPWLFWPALGAFVFSTFI